MKKEQVSKNIIIAGIPVEIQRKKIKNMHLKVKAPDGRVEITAPLRMGDAQIISFVEGKLGWICKHREKIAAQAAQNPWEYRSGETLYVWGVPHTLLVENCTRGRDVSTDGYNVILSARGGDTAGQKEACLNEWYRGLLKEKIAERLPLWEQRTGLYCTDWQVKNMSTRWGTCNTVTKKIWINLQLAKKTVECLDYILLHELCHLRVKNHGPQFKALLDQYMPDWRQIIRSL